MSGLPPDALGQWWVPLGLLALGVIAGVLRAWLGGRQAQAAPPPPPLPTPVHVRDRGRQNEAKPAARPATGSSALRDPLTGLASRLLLEDRLGAAVMRAEARSRRIALLYIDLDGFKPVNELLGYGAGDLLLKEVGRRLEGLGRSTDLLSRMAGDEFLMLLDGDPDASSAALVAERVRQAVQRPCLLQGKEVRLSCSIGIVLYPDHGPKGRLIAHADAAMLEAKRAGGNVHCFYEPRMEHDAEPAIDMQRDLRDALETGKGLALHYQPKVGARLGQLTGVEALLRWRHPVRGAVSPVEFIPVAERFGLIGTLGQWVLEEACRQHQAWREAGHDFRVAINLSMHQVRQADLPVRVQDALARHGVPAASLTFEVTESAAMEDPHASLRLFERLAAIGVTLSIDDFGTGYSSLSYLRKLPATQLKIDRSFVQDLEQEEDARAIVKAVVRLAHALGLTVVAEGVETPGQHALLRRMGCDELQGYLFGRPMPADELLRWTSGHSQTP